MKNSRFHNGKYEGYKVKTILVFEGQNKYKKEKLTTSDEVYEFFSELCNKDKENFYVVLLDRRNAIIGVNKVSEGGLDSTLVHPREVFKPAILCSASTIMLIHNHPSGDYTPSKEDTEITQQLEKAGEILGIPILDHLIVGMDGYYSFASQRML